MFLGELNLDEELFSMEVAALKGNGERTYEGTGVSNDGADPLVYQLVRVEGDGSLVPATEDDVMQFEHLLDVKNDLPLIEDVAQLEQYFSDDAPLSNKLGVDAVGSEDSLLDSKKLDDCHEEETIEPAEVITGGQDLDGQRSEHESDILHCLEHASDMPRRPVLDQISTEMTSTLLTESDSKLQSDNTSTETGLQSMVVDDFASAEKESEYGNSFPANKDVTKGFTGSKINVLQDLAAFKGEICLDKLTIRELQEAFRIIFQRPTTVKDKIWLKRRIALGLNNSREVPTSGLIIKDGGETITHVTSNAETCSPLQDQVSESGCDSSKAMPKQSHQNREQVSGKRLQRGLVENDAQGTILEDCPVVKRMRKPTKRYIEELPDFGIQVTTARYSAGKSAQQCTLKSQLSSGHHVSPWNMPFASRQETLGGLSVQIPFVSRMRRGRPRKNFMLKERSSKGEDKSSIEMDNSDLEHETQEQINVTRENTHSNTGYRPSFRRKGGFKRKHHRAWTLCEVLKLIDGVARYGAGKWSEIRKLAFASYSYRTSVDLKDKWRNLIRASIAQLPTENENGVVPKRPVSPMPLPPAILLRVRELAEMQSQSGSKAGVKSKLSDQQSPEAAGKVPGFL